MQHTVCCDLCGGNAGAHGGSLGPMLGPVGDIGGRGQGYYAHRLCTLWSDEVRRVVLCNGRVSGAGVLLPLLLLRWNEAANHAARRLRCQPRSSPPCDDAPPMPSHAHLLPVHKRPGLTTHQLLIHHHCAVCRCL